MGARCLEFADHKSEDAADVNPNDITLLTMRDHVLHVFVFMRAVKQFKK